MGNLELARVKSFREKLSMSPVESLQRKPTFSLKIVYTIRKRRVFCDWTMFVGIDNFILSKDWLAIGNL